MTAWEPTYVHTTESGTTSNAEAATYGWELSICRLFTSVCRAIMGIIVLNNVAPVKKDDCCIGFRGVVPTHNSKADDEDQNTEYVCNRGKSGWHSGSDIQANSTWVASAVGQVDTFNTFRTSSYRTSRLTCASLVSPWSAPIASRKVRITNRCSSRFKSRIDGLALSIRSCGDAEFTQSGH